MLTPQPGSACVLSLSVSHTSDKLGLFLTPLLGLVELLLLAILIGLWVHPAPVLLDEVHQLVAARIEGHRPPDHLHTQLRSQSAAH